MKKIAKLFIVLVLVFALVLSMVACDVPEVETTPTPTPTTPTPATPTPATPTPVTPTPKPTGGYVPTFPGGWDTPSNNLNVTSSGIINGGTYNNVTITDSVADGEVLLKGVTINGTLTVNGGGSNSVVLENTTVNGETKINKEVVESQIPSLKLKGASKVNNIKVDGIGALITSDSGSSIGDITANAPTKILGDAKPNKITANAEVSISSKAIIESVEAYAKAEIILNDGADVETVNLYSERSILVTDSGSKVGNVTIKATISGASVQINGAVTDKITVESGAIGGEIAINSTSSVSIDAKGNIENLVSNGEGKVNLDVTGTVGTVVATGGEIEVSGNASKIEKIESTGSQVTKKDGATGELKTATTVTEELVSIEITSIPNKVVYYVGDNFLTDGLIVTGNYQTKVDAEVKSTYNKKVNATLTLSGGTPLTTVGEIEVTATVEEQTATFKIKVIEKSGGVVVKTLVDRINDTFDVANEWIKGKNVGGLITIDSALTSKSGIANATLNVDNIRANEPIGEGDILSGLVAIFENELAKYEGYTIKLNGNVIFDGTALRNSTLKEALYSVASGFFVHLSEMTPNESGIYLFKILNFVFAKETETYALDFNLNFKGEDVPKIKKMAEVMSEHLEMTLEDDAEKLEAYGVIGETKVAVATVELPDTLIQSVMNLAGKGNLTSSVEIKETFDSLTVGQALNLLGGLRINQIVPEGNVADVTSVLSTINSNASIINKFLSKMSGINIKGTEFIANDATFAPTSGNDEYQKFVGGIISMISQGINSTTIGSYEIASEPNYYAVPVTFTMTMGTFTFTETVVIKLHIEFPLTDADKAEIETAKGTIDTAINDTFIKVINGQAPNSGNRLTTERDGENILLHFSEEAQLSTFIDAIEGTGAKTAFEKFYQRNDIKGFTMAGIDVNFKFTNGIKDKIYGELIALMLAQFMGVNGDEKVSEFIGNEYEIINHCETENGFKFENKMTLKLCGPKTA